MAWDEEESVSDLGGGNSFIIAIDSSLDKSGTIVSFEASDYTLIFGLDMCREVGFEVFDTDVLKVVRNNVAREVVLKKKDLSSPPMKISIPFTDPLLIELVAAQLYRSRKVEVSRTHRRSK